MVKVMIETPYDIESNEHGNFMESIGEMNRDNFFEYTISIVSPLKCDGCGAVNETVQKTNTGEECGQIAWSDLCDYCAKDYEG